MRDKYRSDRVIIEMIVIQISNYAAPYMGNFILSLSELENQLKENGHKTIYIFPEKCRRTYWINNFMINKRIYFVKEPNGFFFL